MLKLDWCSITKKKWGREEKKSKEARKRSRVTFEETYFIFFVRISEIILNMLPNAESLKKVTKIDKR